MFAWPTDRRWDPHGVTRGDRRNGDLCGGPPGKGRVGRGLARLGIAESEPLRLDLGSRCRGPHHLTSLSWLIRAPVTGELERAGGGVLCSLYVVSSLWEGRSFLVRHTPRYQSVINTENKKILNTQT